MKFDRAIAELEALGMLKKAKRQQPKGRFSPEYLAYMKSPEWQDKRRQRLILDDFQCQACGSGDALQVHHSHYRNLGNEPMEDLLTLCKPCHDAITQSIRKRRSRR